MPTTACACSCCAAPAARRSSPVPTSASSAFTTADHALDYERQIQRYVGRLERVQKPTIALIQGYCVGGGAILSIACDLRLASPDARFGVPVARTLGNTLSVENFARLVALLGDMRTKELLFTARLLDAAEALAAGCTTSHPHGGARTARPGPGRPDRRERPPHPALNQGGRAPRPRPRTARRRR